MSDTDEARPGHEDVNGRDISRENFRWLLDMLLIVPLWWLVVVSIAVVLSCLTVIRTAGGAYSVKFGVTTTAVALLAVAWLPAVIRILATVFKQGRAFGFEITGAGLGGLLERFATHEPSGTFRPAEPQEDQGSLLGAEPGQPSPPPGQLPPPWSPEPPRPGWGEEEEEEEEEEEAVEAPDWTFARDRIYEDNQNLFLVHQIKPSKNPRQKYEVFVYLVGAHGIKPSDIVDQADFFLGRYWGNRIFSVRNPGTGQTIGITTSAYGAALCVCRVKFKDSDTDVILQRFLDFEMRWVFEAANQELARS